MPDPGTTLYPLSDEIELPSDEFGTDATSAGDGSFSFFETLRRIVAGAEAHRAGFVENHKDVATGVHGVGAGNVESTSHKGQPNGYASLDGSGLIPDAQIPAGIARDTEVSAAVAALVASAPGTLDTLDELAAALGDDPNFATTVAAQIGTKATDTLVVHKAGAETITGSKEFTAALTITDVDVVLSTTTGTKIGTASGQKLGFLGAVPVAQQANSVDLGVVLSNFGLRASGGNPPLNLGSGALTAGATSVAALTATSIAATGTVALTDTLTVTDAKNIVLGTGTGTKIGTAASQKIGFLNATPIAQEANSIDLGQVLSDFGFRAAGGNPPLNLGSGALTAGASTLGAVTATGLQVSAGNFQVDSSGRVGLARAPVTDSFLTTDAAHPSAATTGAGIRMQPAFPSTMTNQASDFEGNVRTAAASFTLAAANVFRANAPSLGASSAVTTVTGFKAENQGQAGSTNAYGIQVLAQSGAGTLNVGVRINTATTCALWLGAETTATDVTGGVAFGSGRDVTVFRSAANELTLSASAGVKLTGPIVTPAGSESTGAGSALLGANCPAVTATAPYTWLKFKSSDGSTVYVPAWK